ncbi:MAG: helix-turn-helix domain-containing protein [Actinomycetota bacterium]
MKHEHQQPTPTNDEPSGSADLLSRSGGLDGSVLLRVEQACGWLGIGRSTLAELLATSEITSVKLGRARRIPVYALREYVDRLQDDA